MWHIACFESLVEYVLCKFDEKWSVFQVSLQMLLKLDFEIYQIIKCKGLFKSLLHTVSQIVNLWVTVMVVNSSCYENDKFVCLITIETTRYIAVWLTNHTGRGFTNRIITHNPQMECYVNA